MKLCGAVILAGSLALLAVAATAQEAGPGTLALSSAEYALRQFEKNVESAGGREVEPGYYAEKARTQIGELRERFPDDPKVKALAVRLDAALLAARGDTIDVTSEMLAYRKRETEIVDVLASAADAEWKARLEKLRNDATTIPVSFPVPDPRGTPFSRMSERLVVLDGFHWPRDQFTNNGISYVFVGDSSRGYYYVKADAPSFLASYGAIKRYRDRVSRDVPGGWTVVGRITSVRVMVPGAGTRTAARAHAGYIVEPTAIYVPGRTLAFTDGEGGGRFVGEERLPELLALAYSVREVPAEVSPKLLIEIMGTAAKEKNFELFLKCLPEEARGSTSERRSIEYLWGLFQKRYAEQYVHIEVQGLEEVEVSLPGGPEGPRVEKLRAWVKAYDEKGKVTGSLRPVILVRTDGGRWCIERGYPY